MIYFLITALFITSLFAGAALLAVGHLYGTQRMMDKMAKEGKRREYRQTRELKILHSKFSEKAGMGPLIRRIYKEQADPPPTRRIVSSSEIIARAQKNPEPVPAAIKEQFLKDAAPTA